MSYTVKDKIETRGSTLFKDITYDSFNGKLVVEMVNHAIYQYRQIPQSLWQSFKGTSSYGSFYNTYIKGVYQYTRLR